MASIVKALLCVTLVFSTSGLSAQTITSIILKDGDNKDVDLMTYAENGKITVLCFWATWCAPCKTELKTIAESEEFYARWQDLYDIELIAISIDDQRSVERAKSYVAGEDWPFEVLYDRNQDTKRSLSWQTVPFTIILDKNGDIAYKHTGYNPGDEYALEEELARIAEATDDVE